jgi:hypothetical protein
MHSHFAGDVGEQFVAIIEFDPEHGVGQAFSNRALHQYCVFFCSDDADFPFRVGMTNSGTLPTPIPLRGKHKPTRANDYLIPRYLLLQPRHLLYKHRVPS